MSMKARKKQYKHQPLVDVLGRFADVLDEYRINAKRVEICLIKRFFYERLDIQLEFKDQATDENAAGSQESVNLVSSMGSEGVSPNG